jgi:MATE family multidrug resistance protein
MPRPLLSRIRPVIAQRIDAQGRAHVDMRAVLALALPLMANAAVQIVLNLTDMWFIGRISTAALAGVGAVHWPVLVVLMVLGGASLAVQTIVSQAHGAKRYLRASQATWTALWATVCVAPLFIAAGASGNVLLNPFGLDPHIQSLAVEFWLPRVAGASLGAAAYALFGFFNGIGQPRTTVLITACMAISNAVLNQVFVFELDWGVAGSAWATTLAQGIGLAIATAIFLGPRIRAAFRSHLTWRPRKRPLWKQFKLGFPMGLLPAADTVAFAMFQMMQVRLSTTDGATTQLAMGLASVAYMPGFGIALAGTTLVGQSIGAGDKDWAMKLGTRAVTMAALYMGGIGALLALAGPWILPLFTTAHDADSAAVIALGTRVLWLAAAYQLFDGLNLGSGMALRGAGDAAVPALLVLALSWLLFLPLAHAFTFAPGEGWVDFLPQLGWGSLGGWSALVLYMLALGSVLWLRWRSGVWRRIRI